MLRYFKNRTFEAHIYGHQYFWEPGSYTTLVKQCKLAFSFEADEAESREGTTQRGAFAGATAGNSHGHSFVSS